MLADLAWEEQALVLGESVSDLAVRVSVVSDLVEWESEEQVLALGWVDLELVEAKG